MKTDFLIAVMLLLGVATSSVSAEENRFIYGSAVQVNSTTYNCNDLNPRFDQKDLGEITSLSLGGMSMIVWDNEILSDRSMSMYYRIDNGAWNEMTLLNCNFENYNQFQTGGDPMICYPVNISSLDAGSEHKLSVRFQYVNSKGNTLVDTNNGELYTATFKVKGADSGNLEISLFDNNKLAGTRVNSEILGSWIDGSILDVKLQDRTLYRDGSWNTLCLPFSLTSKALASEDSPLYGADIRTLDSSTLERGVLTLNFSESNLNKIDAGVPYIVRWETPDNNPGDEITDPVFKGVQITTKEATTVATSNSFDFVGCFDPVEIDGQDFLYLGAENNLYYPSKPVTIGAFRAFFRLNENAEISAFQMSFEDEDVAGIDALREDASSDAAGWFTLDGRQMESAPRAAGIYFRDGRKVMILPD